MAEGHTIHALAERLAVFVGHRVASSSPGFRFPAHVFDGRVVTDVQAYGKNLLVSFDDCPATAHIHLGMDGSFGVHERRAGMSAGAGRRDAAWRLTSSSHAAELVAPRLARALTADGVSELLARLGPDPLRPEGDPSSAIARIGQSDAPLAALVVDQSVIAGIGNVYRSEILHRLRLNPLAPGGSIGEPEVRAIWTEAATLLAVGVRAGRIVTHDLQVREARRMIAAGRRIPKLTPMRYVYGRDGMPCRTCGTTIETRRLGQQLWWCPLCQADPAADRGALPMSGDPAEP